MDASKQPRPATKTLQAQPWWVVYLPGTAAASAATFLIAGTYVGIKMGLKRGAKLDQQDSGSYARHSAASGPASVAKSAVLPGEPLPGVDARGAFHYKLPNAQGMTAGQLATKAFLYGTLLCLAGSTVLGLGTAWYFDAWTLDAFARRMEEVVPKGKGKLERWLQTPLSAVAGTSKTFAEGVKGTLGSTIAANIPPIQGVGPEEESAGLTSRDKKLLEEIRAMFEEADREATATAMLSSGASSKTTSVVEASTAERR